MMRAPSINIPKKSPRRDEHRARRDTDARKARSEASKHIDPAMWHTPETVPESMSLEALIAHFDRVRRRAGAAAMTVEALVYALRKGGIALDDSDNRRRLQELSEGQLHEVCARVQKFMPHIARAWSAAEVQNLVTIWVELKNG
jgi:hypothetical protein